MNIALTANRRNKENKPPRKFLNVDVKTVTEPAGMTRETVKSRPAASSIQRRNTVMDATPNSASAAFQEESYGDSFSPAFHQGHSQVPRGVSLISQAGPVNLTDSEQKSSTAPFKRTETGVVASIIRKVESASGTGCESVVGNSNKGNINRRDTWTTRSFRSKMESSCTIELSRRSQTDVTVRVLFADSASTPKTIAFAHAASPLAHFEKLGEIRLQSQGASPLQHVFQLGSSTTILKYLRLTFAGNLTPTSSGAHRVRKLRIEARVPLPVEPGRPIRGTNTSKTSVDTSNISQGSSAFRLGSAVASNFMKMKGASADVLVPGHSKIKAVRLDKPHDSVRSDCLSTQIEGALPTTGDHVSAALQAWPSGSHTLHESAVMPGSKAAKINDSGGLGSGTGPPRSPSRVRMFNSGRQAEAKIDRVSVENVAGRKPLSSHPGLEGEVHQAGRTKHRQEEPKPIPETATHLDPQFRGEEGLAVESVGMGLAEPGNTGANNEKLNDVRLETGRSQRILDNVGTQGGVHNKANEGQNRVAHNSPHGSGHAVTRHNSVMQAANVTPGHKSGSIRTSGGMTEGLLSPPGTDPTPQLSSYEPAYRGEPGYSSGQHRNASEQPQVTLRFGGLENLACAQHDDSGPPEGKVETFSSQPGLHLQRASPNPLNDPIGPASPSLLSCSPKQRRPLISNNGPIETQSLSAMHGHCPSSSVHQDVYHLGCPTRKVQDVSRLQSPSAPGQPGGPRANSVSAVANPLLNEGLDGLSHPFPVEDDICINRSLMREIASSSQVLTVAKKTGGPPPPPPPPPPKPKAPASPCPSLAPTKPGVPAPPPPPPKSGPPAPSPPPSKSRPPAPPPPPPKSGPGAPPAPPPPPPPKTAGSKTPGSRPPPPPPPRNGRGSLLAPPPPKATGVAPPLNVPAPSKPMVKLFWEKLPPYQVVDTVWKELQPLHVSVDFSMLEEEFAARSVGNAPGSGFKALRPSRVSILQMQRSNNVAVFLSRLKMTTAEIKATILSPDGQTESSRRFTEDELTGLLQAIPTGDERKALSTYHGDVRNLGDVEQFMLEMMTVPQVSERLQAARFQMQFNQRVAHVADHVDTLARACAEVRKCTLLPAVLKVSLAVGNFLNAGNRNGAAAGFKLDALLKFKDVRSTGGRDKTLLHFVARQVAKHNHGQVGLKAALPSVMAAAKIQLSSLEVEVADLVKGLHEVTKAVEDISNDGVEDFKKAAQTFLVSAGSEVDRLQSSLKSSAESFKQLAAYINGAANAKMPDPQSFFTLLSSFANDLDMAHDDNCDVDAVAGKASSSKKGLAKQNGPSPTGNSLLKKRDNMLATVRAYSRLRAPERRTLLTEQGARERLKTLNVRTSVPAFSVTTVNAGKVRGSVASKGNPVLSPLAGSPLRFSCPSHPLGDLDTTRRLPLGAPVLSRATKPYMQLKHLRASISSSKSRFAPISSSGVRCSTQLKTGMTVAQKTLRQSLRKSFASIRKSADGIAALQLHLDHPNRYLSGIEASPGPLGKGFPTLHLSPLPVVEFSEEVCDSAEAGSDSNGPCRGFSSIDGYTTPGPLKTSALRVPSVASSPTGTTPKGSASRLNGVRASLGKGTSLGSLPPVHEDWTLDTVPEVSQAEVPCGTFCETPADKVRDSEPARDPALEQPGLGLPRPSPLRSLCKPKTLSNSANIHRWDTPSPTSTPLKKLGSRMTPSQGETPSPLEMSGGAPSVQQVSTSVTPVSTPGQSAGFMGGSILRRSALDASNKVRPTQEGLGTVLQSSENPCLTWRALTDASTPSEWETDSQSSAVSPESLDDCNSPTCRPQTLFQGPSPNPNSASIDPGPIPRTLHFQDPCGHDLQGIDFHHNDKEVLDESMVHTSTIRLSFTSVTEQGAAQIQAHHGQPECANMLKVPINNDLSNDLLLSEAGLGINDVAGESFDCAPTALACLTGDLLPATSADTPTKFHEVASPCHLGPSLTSKLLSPPQGVEDSLYSETVLLAPGRFQGGQALQEDALGCDSIQHLAAVVEDETSNPCVNSKDYATTLPAGCRAVSSFVDPLRGFECERNPVALAGVSGTPAFSRGEHHIEDPVRSRVSMALAALSSCLPSHLQSAGSDTVPDTAPLGSNPALLETFPPDWGLPHAGSRSQDAVLSQCDVPCAEPSAAMGRGAGLAPTHACAPPTLNCGLSQDIAVIASVGGESDINPAHAMPVPSSLDDLALVFAARTARRLHEAEEACLRASQLGGHNFQPSPGAWRLQTMSPGPLGKFAREHTMGSPSEPSNALDVQSDTNAVLDLPLQPVSPESKPAPLELPLQAFISSKQDCPSTFKPFTKAVDALRGSLEDFGALRQSCWDGKLATMSVPHPIQGGHDPATPGVFHPFETAFAKKMDSSLDDPWGAGIQRYPESTSPQKGPQDTSDINDGFSDDELDSKSEFLTGNEAIPMVQPCTPPSKSKSAPRESTEQQTHALELYDAASSPQPRSSAKLVHEQTQTTELDLGAARHPRSKAADLVARQRAQWKHLRSSQSGTLCSPQGSHGPCDPGFTSWETSAVSPKSGPAAAGGKENVGAPLANSPKSWQPPESLAPLQNAASSPKQCHPAGAGKANVSSSAQNSTETVGAPLSPQNRQGCEFGGLTKGLPSTTWPPLVQGGENIGKESPKERTQSRGFFTPLVLAEMASAMGAQPPRAGAPMRPVRSKEKQLSKPVSAEMLIQRLRAHVGTSTSFDESTGHVDSAQSVPTQPLQSQGMPGISPAESMGSQPASSAGSRFLSPSVSLNPPTPAGHWASPAGLPTAKPSPARVFHSPAPSCSPVSAVERCEVEVHNTGLVVVRPASADLDPRTLYPQTCSSPAIKHSKPGRLMGESSVTSSVHWLGQPRNSGALKVPLVELDGSPNDPIGPLERQFKRSLEGEFEDPPARHRQPLTVTAGTGLTPIGTLNETIPAKQITSSVSPASQERSAATRLRKFFGRQKA